MSKISHNTPGLPSLPLEDPSCHRAHNICHPSGLAYTFDNGVGTGLRATNGACIDAKALAEPATCFCCPTAKRLKGACGVKQY